MVLVGLLSQFTEAPLKRSQIGRKSEEKNLESDREKGEYKLEILIMRAGDEKEFKK